MGEQKNSDEEEELTPHFTLHEKLLHNFNTKEGRFTRMAELVVAYLKRFAEDETKVIVSATKGLLTKYFLVCRFDPQVLVSMYCFEDYFNEDFRCTNTATWVKVGKRVRDLLMTTDELPGLGDVKIYITDKKLDLHVNWG